MNEKLEDLKHIRSMMERSTKFVSLSGMSGVAAGTFALVGVVFAYLMMKGELRFTENIVFDYSLVATGVLSCAGISGLYFSMRKARKNKSKFWMPITFQILKDFSVPMVTGGIFILLQLYHGVGYWVAPTMLIFYGLALIAAGARTYRDIKILGACEIVLGLLSALFVHQGLLFWAIGFGGLHILYGLTMYYKYDMNPEKGDA